MSYLKLTLNQDIYSTQLLHFDYECTKYFKKYDNKDFFLENKVVVLELHGVDG